MTGMMNETNERAELHLTSGGKHGEHGKTPRLHLESGTKQTMPSRNKKRGSRQSRTGVSLLSHRRTVFEVRTQDAGVSLAHHPRSYNETVLHTDADSNFGKCYMNGYTVQVQQGSGRLCRA